MFESLNFIIMKFLNDFKNIFTVLGIVSIIFWTCSSESVLNIVSDDDDSDNYGKYQVAMTNNGSMVIINTETGVLKTYYITTENNGEWSEGSYSFPGTGNLTVNH